MSLPKQIIVTGVLRGIRQKPSEHLPNTGCEILNADWNKQRFAATASALGGERVVGISKP